MEQRSLVALIVKTAGLLLIIYTLALLPAGVAGYVFNPERSAILFFWVVVFPLVVPLLVGGFLFWFPSTTAVTVVGVQSAPGSDLERMLQAVVFAGIGLYVALQGAFDVAYYVALNAYALDEYAVPFDDPVNRAGLISSVISLILGIVLLVGARVLSALVAKLRHGS